MKLVYKNDKIHCVTESLYKILLDKNVLIETGEKAKVSLKSIIKSRLKQKGVDVDNNIDKKINFYVKNIDDVKDINKTINSIVDKILNRDEEDIGLKVNKKIIQTQAEKYPNDITIGVDAETDKNLEKTKHNQESDNKYDDKNDQSIKVDEEDKQNLKKMFNYLITLYKGDNTTYVNDIIKDSITMIDENSFIKDDGKSIIEKIQNLLNEYRESKNYNKTSQKIIENIIKVLQKYVSINYYSDTTYKNYESDNFYNKGNTKNLLKIYSSIQKLSENIVNHVKQVFTLATGTLGGQGVKGSLSMLVGGYKIEQQSFDSSYKQTVVSYYLNAVRDTSDAGLQDYMESIFKDETKNKKIIDTILKSCYVMTCNNSLTSTYLNAIRYDDYLSSNYSIRTLSKMKPLEAEEQVLYFVSNAGNERMVVCMLIVRPTFNIMRKIFKNGISLPKTGYKI